MAIVKMKRLHLLSLAADKDQLLQLLLKAGCVEVNEMDAELADPEWKSLVRKEQAMVGSARSAVTSVNAALETLKKYAGGKSSLFILRKELGEEAFCDGEARTAALEKAALINEYNRQISQANSQKNRIGSQRIGLLPWRSLDVDLSLRETENARLAFGVFPAAVSMDELHLALLEKDLAAECFHASSDREQHYVLMVYHKDEEDTVMEVLRPFSFNPSALKDIEGSAEENILALESEIEELDNRRVLLEEEIASFSVFREALQLCADQMTQELSKEEARSRLVTTGNLIYLKGWVPAPDIKKLEEVLKDFVCAIEITDPGEQEMPPTELRNSKLIHSMEMVTEMYSLPSYRGVDPNPLIFPFFTIFYGMMYGDVAYGIVLIVLSQFIIRKYRPKGVVGNILQLATICGVSALIWGFLSGSIFGDAASVIAEEFLGIENFVLYVPVLDPLADPLKILYLAIIMGVIQLMVGMCIKIYMCFRDGHPLDALFDVGSWWLLFAGIGLLALKGTPVILYAGIAALVLTQGRESKGFLGKLGGGIASLYNITSWLGDVLSYTRLMALMLATTVIASVVNILGSLPGNIFAFFLIFIFGHTFNMGINLIGTYVHAARLQYLEYFSKFYKSGGRPFKPLRYNTKYVDVIPEEEVNR
jgi:V/A-type H+-transporting ATPase subunit I